MSEVELVLFDFGDLFETGRSVGLISLKLSPLSNLAEPGHL